jgi:hypothetical protein
LNFGTKQFFGRKTHSHACQAFSKARLKKENRLERKKERKKNVGRGSSSSSENVTKLTTVLFKQLQIVLSRLEYKKSCSRKGGKINTHLNEQSCNKSDAAV